MPLIGLQLYTLRDLASKDFKATLRAVAKIGYAGVEFAGLHNLPAAEVKALLVELGMRSCSAHVPMPTTANVEAMAAEARTLGYTRLICGTDPGKLATATDVDTCVRQFAEGSQLAKARGLSLGLHNHWWELDHDVNGQTPYASILKGAPDVFSELDVYWCEVAGKAAPQTVATWKSRIPLLHIKDGPFTPRSPMLAVGKGKVNVPAIAAAADSKVLEWMIVELDECATDMLQAVADSYQYLTSKGLAQGRG